MCPPSSIMNEIKIKLENRSVVVSKLPLKRYADLLQAVQKLPQKLSGMGDLSNDAVFANLPQIIADSLPDFVNIITIATDLKKDEVNELGLDEVVEVVIAIAEVNKYKQVYEKIKKAIAQNQVKTDQNPSIGSGGQ